MSFVQPTDEEIEARDLVLAKVTEIVHSRLATATVSTYGSVAYGLCLPDGFVVYFFAQD